MLKLNSYIKTLYWKAQIQMGVLRVRIRTRRSDPKASGSIRSHFDF
jgi:hypothetical protein